MSTLINRLFNRSESHNKQTSSPTHSTKAKDFLKFFYAKATESSALNALINKKSKSYIDTDAPNDQYKLVQHYLEVEHYLIHKDKNFWGDTVSLRNELHQKFPEISDSTPFEVLKYTENEQEISLALLLALFLYNRASDHYGNLKLPAPDFRISKKIEINKLQANIVYYLSSRRKIKEYIELLSIEVRRWCDENDSINLLKEWNLEFNSYYDLLETSEKMSYYILNEIIGATKENSPKTSTHSQKVTRIASSSLEIVKDTTLYKSALENLLDRIIIFDRSGTLLNANDRARKLFSLDEITLSDMKIFDLLPLSLSEDLKRDLDDFSQITNRKIIGKKKEARLKNGKVTLGYFEIATSNNYTEEEDTFTMLFKDITKKRDTLKTLNKEMEHVQRAAKAKSTFLSNMSHEIRTPLNVILGLSDIIRKSDNEDRALFRKNIEGIDFSAKSLLSIVNDILDFSKIEAEKLSIQSYDYNLRTVITSLTDGFVTKVNEKGVNLYTEIDEDIPDIVIGDQYRLNQILTNLIGNAIKFTEEGEIRVIVTYKELSSDMIETHFEIRDTGIGMSEDQLEHIFDSFYQIDAAGHSRSNGTGLGLAISKELIHLQQGELSVKSIEGKGSSFTFNLPMKKSKLQSTKETNHNDERNDGKLIGLNILVADDNTMNQFYLKQLLNNLKIDVDIAENGQQAVDIFNSKGIGHYDLILMDLHMPILGGIGAIEKIRQSNKDSRKKVPIVVCSADVFPESRKKAIKAGIDFYLTKPVDEKALKEVLFWLKSGGEADLSIPSENNNDNRSSTVDIKKLNETFDNDEEFLISLLEVFIADTPEDYKSLSTCIEREYFDRASELAHKMKSSYMNLGMTSQGYLLQQIEQNINTKEHLDIGKKYFDTFTKTYTKTLLDVNIQLIELKRKV